MTMHTLQDLIALGETEDGRVTLRLTLAKLCNWSDIDPHWEGYHQEFCGIEGPFHVPDYPNDLNACHEVEMSLNESQHHQFAAFVRKIVPGNYMHESFRAISATALQRTIALILTLQHE